MYIFKVKFSILAWNLKAISLRYFYLKGEKRNQRMEKSMKNTKDSSYILKASMTHQNVRRNY